ncbi:LLM class flavin-dependent oxidoreductase [Amycolatopsis sp. TNS106]|uniref:LLM class flavin-dependent oxidoreductase n=1 Tax=Amycolatopsis sp. TNS106 TaxID=2861750 RepID=UPI001C57518A|nr:LLM class flavin-dependent oxidoreductase [Amycolatopsis sp. TNS106]QXV61641.1 LLM class flavin-dependent oxidoreductase [Amycolatopsis sp. TNS106]
MKSGLVIPTYRSTLDAGRTAPEMVAIAVEAERLGFDSVWVGDTFARAPIDPLTLLGAFAARTERVTLGTAALLPALRDPLLSANTILSLDLLSQGRITLGVGAGFAGRSEPEFAFTRVPWERRRARLDDIVALWRHVWSGNSGPFHGDVLHYDTLPEYPEPHRPGGPPVWLAAFTPGALERAGRLYDGWLPYPPDVADYAGGLAKIRETAVRSVTPALFATVLIEEDPVRARERLEDYARRNYGVPLDFVEKIQVYIAGSPAQVADRVREYRDAGAEHVLIRIATQEPAEFDEQLPKVADALPR